MRHPAPSPGAPCATGQRRPTFTGTCPRCWPRLRTRALWIPGWSNSQDLWIGVSRDLLITSGFLAWFVGSFHEPALLEGGAGADQSDEVGRVDGTPAGLCRLDELERHGHAGCSRAGSLGDPLPQPHGGEG